jgi:hypothetical protein
LANKFQPTPTKPNNFRLQNVTRMAPGKAPEKRQQFPYLFALQHADK